MAKKYYAVKDGRKTGLFATWDECKEQVHGYPNAAYKSFTSQTEAEAYLEDKNVEQDTGNSLKIYVDGSFHAASQDFSYGMVVLSPEEEYKFACRYHDTSLATMHNVAGEIKGAQAAMKYALLHQISEITIFHDYAGISKWCTGEWKANKEGTKAYKAFYDEVCQQIHIHFQKVTGHSHDKYNDMADALAKQALGIGEAVYHYETIE